MSRTEKPFEMDPRCTELAGGRLGPFVRLDNGQILTVEENATVVSEDGGRTWSEPRPIYRGEGPGRPGEKARR